jgi:sulfatase maturation enzyme AslB (radical SAM superfamily)
MNARNTDSPDGSLSVPEYVSARLKEVPTSKLWRRYSKVIKDVHLAEVPPFPRQVLIELANICNHACVFCAYPRMTRPRQYIKPDLFRRIMAEAYELGAREVGLHGGSEPLTCKKLEEYVAFCHEIGFEYIYFSTNGALGTPKRFKALVDSGTSSIKFSINGGNRETYHKIHGRDDFDKVLANLRFVAEYRKTLDREVFLAVSFVEVPENRESLSELRRLTEPLIDEFFHVHASNQSGQMLNLPVAPYLPKTCQIPFNQVNITREGYLRACCNDYQNNLALVDLNTTSLREGWAHEKFRSLRRRHLADKLEGTLCHACVHGKRTDVRPLDPNLGDWGAIE